MNFIDFGIPKVKEQLHVMKNQIVSICYCRSLDYQITIRGLIESFFTRDIRIFVIDSLDLLRSFLDKITQELTTKDNTKLHLFYRFKVLNQEYLVDRLKFINEYIRKTNSNALLVFNLWKIFKRDFKKLKARSDAVKEIYQTISMIAKKIEFTLLCEEMLEGFHPLDCTPPPGLEIVSHHIVKFLPYNTLYINEQKIRY